MLIVISPCSWPVRIFGLSGDSGAGSARKSNARPLAGILELAYQRQAKPQQTTNQLVLGRLQTLPAQQVLRLAEVRDGTVEAAGATERVRRLRRHQPVASPMNGIGAEAVDLLRADSGRQRPPFFSMRALRTAPSGR